MASAITGKGVTTASDATFATMANNIKSISKGKCIYLGTGTSFNVQTVCANNGLNYKSLTKSNFIVGVTSGSSTTSAFGPYDGTQTRVITSAFSVDHAYNATTGVLSVSGTTQSFTLQTASGNTSNASQTMTAKAWLIYTS